MSVSRNTPGGIAYLDLQKQARSSGRPVQELLQLYVLEAFLDRLTRSTLREAFTLKGGVLLAVYGQRRPTRDIDLQAKDVSNDVGTVLAHVVDIASIAITDGVEFRTGNASSVLIRDEDAYTGVRVSMAAGIASAKLDFHVDVNVGDPVLPPPTNVELPRLLGGSINIRGYPLEMVHAEKIVTAIARGTVNTRWRDFMDVVSLAAHHAIDGNALIASVRRVAEHRQIALEPLETVLDEYGEIGQAKWEAWRRKQQLVDRSPESFEELIRSFIAFAAPVVLGNAAGQQWYPYDQTWR